MIVFMIYLSNFSSGFTGMHRAGFSCRIRINSPWAWKRGSPGICWRSLPGVHRQAGVLHSDWWETGGRNWGTYGPTGGVRYVYNVTLTYDGEVRYTYSYTLMGGVAYPYRYGVRYIGKITYPYKREIRYTCNRIGTLILVESGTLLMWQSTCILGKSGILMMD